MTVQDFIDLLVDDSQQLRLYDVNADENIYTGEASNVPDYLQDVDVVSIDPIYKVDFDGFLTLNIEPITDAFDD